MGIIPKITIPLSIPTKVEHSDKYIKSLFLETNGLNKDRYQRGCIDELRKYYSSSELYMCNSCSSALFIALLSLELNEGDEVILPAFTHVGTSNAIALAGGKLVFVDIDPRTMTLNSSLVKKAINKKTKAVLFVNYGSLAKGLKELRQICDDSNVVLIEDAAHSILSSSHSKAQGTWGDISTISFDHMKNVTCGQGGLLLLNNKKYKSLINQIHQNGTNRLEFNLGNVNKYEWTSLGNNFLMSELQASYLLAQLEKVTSIVSSRISKWKYYFDRLLKLESLGYIQLMKVQDSTEINGHIFFIKTRNRKISYNLISYFRKHQIQAAPHYSSLVESPMGKKTSTFFGADVFTSYESRRLVRLPIFASISTADQDKVLETLYSFFGQSIAS